MSETTRKPEGLFHMLYSEYADQSSSEHGTFHKIPMVFSLNDDQAQQIQKADDIIAVAVNYADIKHIKEYKSLKEIYHIIYRDDLFCSVCYQFIKKVKRGIVQALPGSSYDNLLELNHAGIAIDVSELMLSETDKDLQTLEKLLEYYLFDKRCKTPIFPFHSILDGWSKRSNFLISNLLKRGDQIQYSQGFLKESGFLLPKRPPGQFLKDSDCLVCKFYPNCRGFLKEYVDSCESLQTSIFEKLHTEASEIQALLMQQTLSREKLEKKETD